MFFRETIKKKTHGNTPSVDDKGISIDDFQLVYNIQSDLSAEDRIRFHMPENVKRDQILILTVIIQSRLRHFTSAYYNRPYMTDGYTHSI